MRTLVFHSPQGSSTTVPADIGTVVRVARGEGRPGEISVVHRPHRTIDVKVSVDTLSSHHAEFYISPRGVEVKDTGSTNGTLIRVSPGEKHLCNGRVHLGSDVHVEVHDGGWSFPADAPITTVDDLVLYLRTRLRDVGCQIELTPATPTKSDNLQTVLPLAQGKGLLVVVWPHGTVNLAVDGWLRALINDFNGRQSSATLAWRFTAHSPERLKTLDWARRVAPFEAPVLLLGPSGSGKGILAQDIHDHSARARGPFKHVNCTAVPAEIFEREFFGHARGAYTSAATSGEGFVQAADGGTLFLDEIGDLPLPLQAKLLTFVEGGKYSPVGSPKTLSANVRIVAATNRDLESMLGTAFRADLFYRLSTIKISVTPPEAAELRAAVITLAPEVASRNHVTLLREEVEQLADLASTRTYAGHFRELQSALTRYLFLRENGRTIEETWNAAWTCKESRSALEQRAIDIAIPRENRDAFVTHIENYAQLQLARRASSVQELAVQTRKTAAAVYAWLKRIELKPEDIGDTQAIRDAISNQVDALRPFRPLMGDLLSTGAK